MAFSSAIGAHDPRCGRYVTLGQNRDLHRLAWSSEAGYAPRYAGAYSYSCLDAGSKISP